MGRLWINPFKSSVPLLGDYDINVVLEALKLKECRVSVHVVFNPKVIFSPLLIQQHHNVELCPLSGTRALLRLSISSVVMSCLSFHVEKRLCICVPLRRVRVWFNRHALVVPLEKCLSCTVYLRERHINLGAR